VELLDGSGAGLHVRFYSPREGIVRLLQERATRVRSSPAVERTGAPPCRSNHS
jgi:hypothetical protein